MRYLCLSFFLLFTAQTASARRSPSPAGKYNPQALDLILNRVKETIEAGKKPVVLFDLDETLVNSRTRTLRILRTFAGYKSFQERFPKETTRLLTLTNTEQALENRALEMESYTLYLNEIMLELGIFNDAFLAEIKTTYLDSYLSDAFCVLDTPMPGAVAYAKAVQKAGAKIVYMTGRPRPNMGLCTDENLLQKGFPFGEKNGVVLLMKPNKDMDDTDFKKKALKDIGNLGVVVGGFENEPANLNAFKEAFPDATYVFVDSMHSNRPDRPFDGAHYIRNYSYKTKSL